MRIAVTRPQAQSASLLAGLRELQDKHGGFEIVNCPLIEIVDPRDGGEALKQAVGDLSDYEWIVFTSTNAVERTFGEKKVKVKPSIAAVGEATAQAVQARGAKADKVAPEGNARSLVDAMPKAKGSGRVLFPRSALARDTIIEGLTEKGWKVDDVEAYRVMPAKLDDDAALKARNADAVLFASPSAVKAYVDHVATPLPSTAAVCIGAQTAQAAERSGFRKVVTAQPSTDEGLIRAVAKLVS